MNKVFDNLFLTHALILLSVKLLRSMAKIIRRSKKSMNFKTKTKPTKSATQMSVKLMRNWKYFHFIYRLISIKFQLMLNENVHHQSFHLYSCSYIQTWNLQFFWTRSSYVDTDFVQNSGKECYAIVFSLILMRFSIFFPRNTFIQETGTNVKFNLNSHTRSQMKFLWRKCLCK